MKKNKRLNLNKKKRELNKKIIKSLLNKKIIGKKKKSKLNKISNKYLNLIKLKDNNK